MELDKSKVFCVLPFIHAEIDTNGSVGPCCVYLGEYRRDDGTPFQVRTDGLASVIASESRRELQRKMLKDIPVAGCIKCYQEEAGGNVSRRMRENSRFGDEIVNILMDTYNIRVLDLKFGNTCNLKCVNCNDVNSSKWLEDTIKIYNKDRYTSEELLNFKWYNNPEVFEELSTQLSKLTHLELFGGEPFLVKQQWDFLQLLIDLGVSKHIEISYTTNGTVWPEYAIEHLWPKFKSINLMLSADGIESTFEYNRFPAKWTDFQTNLFKFKQLGFNITISYTVSIFNIFNLIDSLKFYHDNGIRVWLNTAYDENKTVSCLPDNIKQYLVNSIEQQFKLEWQATLSERTIDGVISQINLRQGNFDKFIEYTKSIDSIRQQSILSIIPELKDYF